MRVRRNMNLGKINKKSGTRVVLKPPLKAEINCKQTQLGMVWLDTGMFERRGGGARTGGNPKQTWCYFVCTTAFWRWPDWKESFIQDQEEECDRIMTDNTAQEKSIHVPGTIISWASNIKLNPYKSLKQWYKGCFVVKDAKILRIQFPLEWVSDINKKVNHYRLLLW